jgi:hypothetical protein
MEPGICKLCLEEKMLCESHLAPAGLYRYCKAKELGPVSITADEIMVSHEEVTAFLLCQGCEELLNREGENWLLPKLATIDKKFPFYDLLASGAPDTTDGDVAAFACSRNEKIGFRKLTNFAIGVFWKASVHPWRDNSPAPWINLGKYSQAFRLFLADRKPFPEKAVLTVGVLPPEKAVIGFSLPIPRGRHPYNQYVFYIPGIIFVLSVGNLISSEDKRLCFFSDPLHPIILADFSKDIFGMVRNHTKRAVASREVANHITKRRREAL